MSKDKALAAKLREVSGLGDGNMRAHADVIRQWTAEAATRLEALQAQPVGEAHKTEYGWLIELDGPQGLSYCIGSKFDPDHAKALRFARREDAQAFCDQLSVAHTRIAEHGWD